MTTAARPTFEPAQGGRGKGEGDLSALSKQYSSRDLPGHTKLKTRWVLVGDNAVILKYTETELHLVVIRMQPGSLILSNLTMKTATYSRQIDQIFYISVT